MLISCKTSLGNVLSIFRKCKSEFSSLIFSRHILRLDHNLKMIWQRLQIQMELIERKYCNVICAYKAYRTTSHVYISHSRDSQQQEHHFEITCLRFHPTIKCSMKTPPLHRSFDCMFALILTIFITTFCPVNRNFVMSFLS